MVSFFDTIKVAVLCVWALKYEFHIFESFGTAPAKNNDSISTYIAAKATINA
jgi:hypothetical protein